MQKKKKKKKNSIYTMIPNGMIYDLNFCFLKDSSNLVHVIIYII